MKTLTKLLLALGISAFSITNAATIVVDQSNSGNPPSWGNTPTGTLTWAIATYTAGDTIVFDYNTLGANPVIDVTGGFPNEPNIGGFIIDGFRGLTPGDPLIQFNLLGATGDLAGVFNLSRPNTVIRGIDFSNINGYGLWISSNNTVIDSCYFQGAQKAGLYVANGALNTVIKNSIIANNYQTNPPNGFFGGITSYGQIFVDSCYIYGNSSHGVLIDGVGAANSRVTNCVIGRDIAGVDNGNSWNGIYAVNTNGVIVEDNIVVDNGHDPFLAPEADKITGVRFESTTNSFITNNYIGTDSLKSNSGNSFDGITLYANVSNVEVRGNVIAYNGFGSSGAGGGLAMRISSNSNIVQSNFIGVHRDSTAGGNNEYGISLEGGNSTLIGGATSNLGNIIGYSANTPNAGKGIWISFAAATDNEVYNNLIIGNTGAGIEIQASANGNVVGANGQGNAFVNNNIGILVRTAGANSNTLRFNSFSCNVSEGISLQDNGNDNYGNAPFAPASKSVIVNTAEQRPDFISGYVTSPNAFVDVYAPDNVCPLACDNNASQGLQMITTVNSAATPSSNGLYFWEYDFVAGGNQVDKDNVVVLATESGSPGATNTSEFSVCANLCNKPENASINGNDLEICDGETTILTVNSTGKPNDEDYSYTWYSPSIDPANIVAYNINDSTLTVNSGGVYVALISSQLDSVSCSDTSTFSTVILNDLPNVALTSSANQFCDEDSITLNAGLPTGDFNFNWLPNIGNTNKVVTSTGGSFKVIVTNNTTGCVDSNTVSVTRNDLPTINLTASEDEFCDQDSVTLNAGVTATGFSFSWSPNTGSTNEVIVKDGGTFKVVVTNTTTGCVDSSFVSVIKNSLPIPSPSAAFFCQGDSTLVDAGVASLNYLWMPGAFTSQSFYTSVEDTFFLTVTDPVTGCVETDSVFADQSPDPKPIVTLPVSDTVCVLRGDVIDIRADITSETAGNLVWSNGVTNESVISVSDSIVYIATYTDGFGCVGADTIKVENLCIPPDPLLPNIVTVNNPWTPFGEVDATQFVESSLSVFNRWGTIVYETKEMLPEWNGKHKNGSDCSSGVYFYVWDYTDISGETYKLNGFMHLIIEQ